MDHNEESNSITMRHDEHVKEHFKDLPWKAWGSWFSWGSPVGLGLGWTLFIIPLGIFLLLLHEAGLLR